MLEIDPKRVFDSPESKPNGPPAAKTSAHSKHSDLEWYELGPLPVAMRIALYFAGWLLVLFGLLELVLPGPGLLFIFFGAAILSLASEATHRTLRSVLKFWPAGHNRMERMRARLHRRLSGDDDHPTPRRHSPGPPEA